MRERNKVFLLILIMIFISLIVITVATYLLYNASLDEQKVRLVETAQSQARLIEAIARHDTIYHTDYPGGAEKAALDQIKAAHANYYGFGETGEFTLARRVGDEIIFLLSHRHFDRDYPKPVPIDSELAEPMRRALSGMSGTVFGLDYRGEKVFAAYEPVGELNLGIVAKIDLAEIRAPFVRANLKTLGTAVLAVILGALLFFRITSPIIKHLAESEERFRSLVEASPDGITLTDLDGKILMCNPHTVILHGFESQEDIIGKSSLEFMSPEEQQKAKDNMEKTLQDGTVRNVEYTLLKKDGTHFPGEVSASLIVDKEGKSMAFVAVTRDITVNRKTSEILKKRTFNLGERVKELNCLYELDQIGRDENLSIEEILTKAARLIPPGWQYPEVTACCITFEEKKYQTKNFKKTKWIQKADIVADAEKKGSIEVCYLEEKPNSNEGLFLKEERSLIDAVAFHIGQIIEHKMAEKKLKIEKAYIDQLFESAQEAIVMADKNGNVMRANNEFINLFGFASNNEVVGKQVDDLIVPDDALEIAKSITNRVRMGDSVSLETVRQRKDGKLIDVSILASPINVDDVMLGVYGIYRDISKRKESEKKLRESAVYLDIIGDVVMVCDPQLRVTKVNKPFSNLWEYTPKEVLGKPLFELFKKGEMSKHISEMEKAAREGGVRVFETIALTKEKKEIDVSITGTVLKDGKGKTLNFIALFRDISERKHAEKIQASLYELSEATNLTRNIDDLFSSIHKIVAGLMPAENFYIALYNSQNDTVSFPYFVDEIEESLPPRKGGKGLTEYVIRTGKPILAPFEMFKKLEKKGEVELIGDPWVHWLGVPLKIKAKTIGVLTLQSYSEDIRYGEREKDILLFVSTHVAMAIERKQAEAQLKSSLKEKDVLLREIHHRVKNNLQVISSLLLLQSKHIRGKKNLELFKESQNRIKSMALIHEKLYQSQDLSSINFKEYLNTLIIGLFRSYQAQSGHVELNLNVDDISLGIDSAIPCGLIINELVSNSLKYAFPNDREGKINVALRSLNKKDVELVVSDNGVGMPKDLDFRKTESMGLHLVTILAEDQLEGEINLLRDKGTEFRIRLKGLK